MGVGNLGLRDLERGGTPNYSLDVGSVLSRSFSVWFRNLPSFVVLALVITSPGLLCMAAPLFGAPAVLTPVGNLLERILTLVLTGAITYGVFQELRDQRASLSEILSAGFSNFGAVLGAGMLAGLAIAAGFCALLVPGIYLSVIFWVALPVAVVESPGASNSLSRSADLTQGNRWQVLGILAIVAVVTVSIALVTGAVLGALGLMNPTKNNGALVEVLTSLALLPATALQAVAPVVVYHDLVIGKEGADIQDLVRVFE